MPCCMKGESSFDIRYRLEFWGTLDLKRLTETAFNFALSRGLNSLHFCKFHNLDELSFCLFVIWCLIQMFFRRTPLVSCCTEWGLKESVSGTNFVI